MNDNPNLVHSRHGADIAIDGYRFEVQIFRAEHETEWLLEVIDKVGASHVWDETFEDDKEAFDAAPETIQQEGMHDFIRGGSNVVQFKPNS